MSELLFPSTLRKVLSHLLGVTSIDTSTKRPVCVVCLGASQWLEEEEEAPVTSRGSSALGHSEGAEPDSSW